MWLDAAKTSPFEFYQFWFNTEDESVEEYLLKMTLMPKAHIEEVMAAQNADPASRAAQKMLAYEVTKLVHGEDIANGCQKSPEILYSKDTQDISVDEVEVLRAIRAPMARVASGDSMIDVLVSSLVASSKREARQFLDDGAITLNGEKITDAARALIDADFYNDIALLKRGRRVVVVLSRI